SRAFSDGEHSGEPPRALAGPARASRPAMAGNPRSVSHLALGSDAAADPGRDGHSLLRALPRAFPGREIARLRATGRRARAVERPGVLLACAQPARGRASGGAVARRPVSADEQGARVAAGSGPL